MSCPILKQDLLDIVQDENTAEKLYSYFETPEFKRIFFGEYDILNNPERFVGRINEENEAILHFNEPLQKYFFIDVNNEPVFYPYTRQGLQKFFTNNDIKTFAKTLALGWFNKTKKLDPENFEFETIDNTLLGEFITSFIDSKIKELKASDNRVHRNKGKALEASKDHLIEWQNETIAFYNSLKIDIKEEEVVDTSNQAEEIRGEIVRVESFLKSSKSNVNQNIRLFLSLLTDGKLNNFNEFNFVHFDDVWKTLNSNLWGLIAVNDEYGIEDEFDLYLDVIKDLAERKKYLKQLVNKLEKADDALKNKFVNAFRLNKNNFLTSEFTKREGKLTHDVLNVSDVSSMQSNILDQWAFNAEQKKLNKTKLTLAKDSLNKHYKELNKDFRKITNDAQLSPHIDNIIVDLRRIGIELGEDQKGLDYFLDDLGPIKTTDERLQNLLTLYLDSIRAIDAAIESNTTDISRDQTTLKNLAKAEAFFVKDGSDASIFSIGKSKWVYSLPSFLSNKINAWKKDPSLLKKHYEASPFNKGSHWMEYLLALDKEDAADQAETSKERLSKVELGIFNSIQEKDDIINAVDNKGLSYVDSLADYANKILAFKKGSKVWHKTVIAADKSTEYYLHFGNDADFLNVSTNLVFVGGKIEVSDQVLEIFYKYFKSEYDRMKVETKFAELAEDHQLTPNYHTGAKNAFKSQLFPSLSIQFTEDGIVLPKTSFRLYNQNGRPIHSNLDTVKDSIKAHIQEVLAENIKQTHQNLIDNNLFTYNSKGERINNAIDTTIYNNYLKEVGESNAPTAILRMAGDMLVNSIMSQVEYSKMFTGDTAFYKNMTDYKKRVPATYTDGQYMRLLTGEEHFNIAVTDSIIIPAPYLKSLKELVGKRIADKYTKINATDGQAWITPERWRFIMERLGKWSKTHESAYDKMNSKDRQPFTDKELKVLGQPLKGVYFDSTKGRPIFLKYSQAVLWEPLIQGTDLQKVREQMRIDGVDELITKDGIKVGYTTPTPIHNSDGSLAKSFKFNTQVLNNNAWKLQQDLPVKGMKPTNVGSQIQKIIFQGLVFNQDKDFDIGKDSMKGDEVIQHLHNVMGDLSNKGLKKIFNKLGIDSNTFEIKDQAKLYESLIEQLKKRTDVPSNFIKALEAGISPYGIPGSFDMFQNVFSSLINGNTVDIKTNGGGFIQMSDYGISRDTAIEQGVIFTPWMDTNKLPTPRFYTGEDGRKKVKPGGIFLTGSIIAKYVPGYAKMSSEKLFGKLNEETGKYEGGVIDQDVLTNIIGYRIPNQGLPSNDAYEILGILPESVGDTVIAYTGITTKTGGDFDIDKMYLMIPSFKPIKNSASKVMKQYGLTEKIAREILKGEGLTATNNPLNDLYDYLVGLNDFQFDMKPQYKAIVDVVTEKLALEPVTRLEYARPEIMDEQTGTEWPLEQQSEAVVQNKLIEAFKGILTNEHVISSVMEPLDIDYISDDIKNMFPEVNRNDMMDFDALSDLDLKFEFALGKAGLGQNVNSLVDAVRGALGNISMHGYSLGEKLTGIEDHTQFDREYSHSLSDQDIKDYVESFNKHEKDLRNHKKLSEVKKNLKKVKLFDSMMALVNGFVDIAKDPYIVRGNWVTQTNNVGFFMLRAGVHPFYVNAFLGQPIVKDYIKFVNNRESKLIDDSGNLINKFMLKKVSDRFNSKEKTTINGKTFFTRTLSQAFFDIHDITNLVKHKESDKYASIKDKMQRNIRDKARIKFGIPKINKDKLLDAQLDSLVNKLMSAHDVIFESKSNVKFKDLTLKNLRDNILEEENLDMQLAVFAEFDDLSKNFAKKLTKSVNSAKVDVKGKGKNITSLITSKNLMESLLEKDGGIGELTGFKTKLKNGINDTFLNTYYQNSILTTYNIMKANPKFFLTASNNVVNSFNIISQLIYGENLQNEELGTKLERSYYSYVMSGFDPFKMSAQEKFDSLNEMPEKFVAKQKEYPNNALLQKLFVKVGEDNSYISMSNVKIGNNEKNDMTDAWKDLMEDDPQFSEDLIKYSFVTSSFNNSISQFHQFIPYEWFNRNRFNSYLKNIQNNEDFDEAFIKQFFKNNAEDQAIVKKVYPKQITSQENYLVAANDALKTGFLSDSNHGYFIKMEMISGKNEMTGVTSYKTQYYRLLGTAPDGKYVYLRNAKLGMKDGKGPRLTEYEINNSGLGSIYQENALGQKDVNVEAYSKMANSQNIQSPFLQEMIEEVEKPVASYESTIEGVVTLEKASMDMKSSNVKKILDGTKTSTIRKTIEKGGGIEVGESKLVNFGGEDFVVKNKGNLTIEEAGGLDVILKSEGLESIDDFIFKQSKTWASGKGKMYVYDISPAKLNEEENLTKDLAISSLIESFATSNTEKQWFINQGYASEDDLRELTEEEANDLLRKWCIK